MAKFKLLKWEAEAGINNIALGFMLVIPFFNMFNMFGYNAKLFLAGCLLALLFLLRAFRMTSWLKASIMSYVWLGFLTAHMFIKNFPDSVFYYILIVAGFVIIRVRFTNRSINWALSIIEFVGIFYALTVIWHWASPDSFYPLLKIFVSEGPYNQAIQLALFDHDYSGFAAEANRAAVCISPAACSLFSKLIFKNERRNKVRLIKHLIFFAVTYSAIVLTGKRAFILFFPTVLVLGILYFMYKSKKKHIILLAMLLTIATIFVTLFVLRDFIVHLLTRGEGTGIALRNRDIYWGLAFDMFKRSPLLGLGMRSYDYYYNIMSGRNIVFAGAHNCYFQFLAEIGAIGTIVYVCFIFTNLSKAAKCAVKCIRKRDSENGKIAIMSLLMQGMYIMLAISEAAFFAPYSLILYFILVNMSENVRKNLKENRIDNLGSRNIDLVMF